MSEQTQAPASSTPEITIPDLVNAYNIIKVAIERAAFKAEEVGDVGAVFNKFGAFLKAAEEQQKAQEKAATEAEASDDNKGA
jgi:hypothetical protein